LAPGSGLNLIRIFTMEHSIHKKKRGLKESTASELPRKVPHEAPLPPMLQLQHQAGNAAVQDLVKSQAGHSQIDPPNSPAEREAESVTERIMRAGTSGTGPEPQLEIQKSPAAHGSAAVPGMTGAIPSGPGGTLDAGTRNFFEPRLGRDLGNVRVHTGNEAADSARNLNALAYTTGEHIVFDAGQYAPETNAGRRLLAHELTHVLQQSARQRNVIQRQINPAAATPPPPVLIQDNAKDEAQWRGLVDQAVRSQFGLRGAGLTKSNVQFLDMPQFAAQFSDADVAEKLFNLFMDYGQDPNRIFRTLLAHNNQPFAYAGPTFSTMIQVRDFIQDGISKGFFEGQSGELDVTTGKPFPPFRVTPRDLLASFVSGVTDISGPRSNHKITMRVANGTSDVDTLVHETCHFYISEGFRNMAYSRTDGDYFLGDARISQILIEGCAEYFARQVMAANASTFGPPFNSYPAEVEQVERLAVAVGEQNLRAAYFGGNATQIKRVSFAVDEYKNIHPDLLLPPSILDYDFAQANPPKPAGGATKP
jgi:hypothetical protein